MKRATSDRPPRITGRLVTVAPEDKSDGFCSQPGRLGGSTRALRSISSHVGCPKPPAMDGEDVAKVVKVINNLRLEAFTEAEISRAKLPSNL